MAKSVSLDGDSGPYLQYTYARCKSIIRNAKADIIYQRDYENISKDERTILQLLSQFPEVVQEADEKYAPNIVCNYVFQIAQAYNHFYNTHPVLKAEEEETRQFRLLLTVATAHVIQNSLYLLGIAAPEKM